MIQYVVKATKPLILAGESLYLVDSRRHRKSDLRESLLLRGTTIGKNHMIHVHWSERTAAQPKLSHYAWLTPWGPAGLYKCKEMNENKMAKTAKMLSHEVWVKKQSTLLPSSSDGSGRLPDKP